MRVSLIRKLSESSTWRKGIEKEAKIAWVTTWAQFKAKTRMEETQEGKQSGFLPSHPELIGEMKESERFKKGGPN